MVVGVFFPTVPAVLLKGITYSCRPCCLDPELPVAPALHLLLPPWPQTVSQPIRKLLALHCANFVVHLQCPPLMANHPSAQFEGAAHL